MEIENTWTLKIADDVRSLYFEIEEKALVIPQNNHK